MKQLSLEIKQKFSNAVNMENFINLLNKKEKKLYISESIIDDEEDDYIETTLKNAMGVDDYAYNGFGINLSIRECEVVRRYCLLLLKNKRGK